MELPSRLILPFICLFQMSQSPARGGSLPRKADDTDSDAHDEQKRKDRIVIPEGATAPASPNVQAQAGGAATEHDPEFPPDPDAQLSSTPRHVAEQAEATRLQALENQRRSPEHPRYERYKR